METIAQQIKKEGIKGEKMKHKLFFIFIILTAALTGLARERASISIQGNYFSPQDKELKEFYGSGHVSPEVKVNVFLFKGFYLWGSAGRFSATGKTLPLLQEESKWTQTFWCLGGGYKEELLPSLAANLRLGISSTSYKEKALDTEIKDSASGFLVSGSLIYHLGRFLFAEFEIGYLTISQEIEGSTLKLGGLKAGAGIGFRF